MNKKILFLFAALFLSITNVYAADYNADYGTLSVRQVNEQWYENGVLKQRTSNDIISFKVNDISFYGDKYTQSTSRVWPYTRVQYLFNQPTFNTSQLYDFDVIAFTDFSSDKNISMRFNGSYGCTPVNQINKISWFRCSNVKLISNDTNYILVSFTNNNASSTGFSFGLSDLRLFESGISTSTDIINYMKLLEKEIQNSNQQIIENQDKNNQEQIENANKNHQEQIENENKNHQETLDTITNGDTSGASSTGSSFFDSFQDSDNGGLSGIITAPLKLVNQMLNEDLYGHILCATWKGKKACLPSGEFFWNGRHKALIDFVNLVETGLLSYWILIDLYKTIEKIKNPEEDKVEVMNL